MIVKNNDLRLIVAGDFRLIPGCNEVKKTAWDKCKKEYNITSYLKSEQLEELAVEKDFKDLEVKEQKNLIEQTFNLITLNNWLETTNDAHIRTLLEKRMDGIKTAKIQTKHAIPKNHT